MQQWTHQRIQEYFDTQLAAINWRHAVNTRQLLTDALEDPTTDFIEVDMRKAPTGALVAHHDSYPSDMTFEFFVEQVKNKRIGLKFDFKDEASAVLALRRLAEFSMSQPIIVNADVIPSFDDNPPIHASRFIHMCREMLPYALPSVGWYKRTSDPSPYTNKSVDRMIRATAEMTQVTYPVRASMLQESWLHLRRLLDTPGRSLTLWNTNEWNDELWAWCGDNIDPNRYFVDAS